jgi:hypothetical protein
MFIKHFTAKTQMVPSPLHPGRREKSVVLRPSGVTHVNHDGKTYKANEYGWIDVPEEVGRALVKFRVNGSGFFTENEVDEQATPFDVEDDTPKRGRKRAPAVE